MRILPEKYFSWREPESFLAEMNEEERTNRRWWHGPAGVFVCNLVLLFVGFMAHLDPSKHPPTFLETLLMGTAVGVLIVYFIPWIISKSESQITVFARRMVRFRGHHQQINFADLTSFAWQRSAEFSTLVLTPRSGAEILIGVPHDFDRNALSAFLSERILPNKSIAYSAMTTKMAIALAIYALFIGLIAGSLLRMRYLERRQGAVVAEAASGCLKIRQIPTEVPGLNGSYAYRCEVWRGDVLYKATTLHYAHLSVEPGKCSIAVISPSRAVFHIDGYDIECTDYGTGSDTHCNTTWKRLNP